MLGDRSPLNVFPETDTQCSDEPRCSLDRVSYLAWKLGFRAIRDLETTDDGQVPRQPHQHTNLPTHSIGRENLQSNGRDLAKTNLVCTTNGVCLSHGYLCSVIATPERSHRSCAIILRPPFFRQIQVQKLTSSKRWLDPIGVATGSCHPRHEIQTCGSLDLSTLYTE